MLIDVLTQFCADTGIDPVAQRSLALMTLNKAASLMYKKLECNKIYREISVLVPSDKVVSLPHFVGEMRGMRMHTNELPFDLHSMLQPRYVQTTWSYKWKNWRDLGESPIKQSLNNIAPLTIESSIASGVSVLISGSTNTAQRIEETIVIDNTTKTTLNSFGPIIWKIACLDTSRTCNITIKDITGTEIATLYNNQKQTRYKVIDVSAMFWSRDDSQGNAIIDLLYKEPLVKLSSDTDSFPASDDYDDAWYYMAMHVYYNPQQGREQDAKTYEALALEAMVSAKGSGEDQQIKKISYGRNKFFGLLKRYRYWPGSITNVDKL